VLLASLTSSRCKYDVHFLNLPGFQVDELLIIEPVTGTDRLMREYSIGISQGLDPILPPEQIERLTVAGQTTRFEKGAYLYRQGEQAEEIYLLVSGRANTLLISSNGQESLLRIHLPGSLMGLTALATKPIRDASAVSVVPCEAVALDRKNLQALLRSDSRLGDYFIQLLLDRMSDFHYRVGELLSQSVEQRLSKALLALSQPDFANEGETAAETIMLTHEQLAHLLNTRRPTVSAALGRLSEAGLIARSGRGIVVTDRQGLARVAAGHTVS
jgi:CRP-like cAMP-binding protein